MAESDTEAEKHPLWQGLVDAAHDIWQTIDDKVGLARLLDSFSEDQKIAFVLAKLNYQVENGGFQQWVENGYWVIHEDTIEALEKIGTENALRIKKLVEKTISYVNLDSDPSDFSCWNDDDNSEDEVFDVVLAQLDEFDDEYYAKKGFMDEVEAFFAKKATT